MTWRWGTVLAVLLTGGLFAVQGGMVSTSEYRELQQSAARLRDSVAVLEEAVAARRVLLDRLTGDPQVQDAEARRRYGTVRAGERVFLVIPEGTAGDSTRGASPP